MALEITVETLTGAGYRLRVQPHETALSLKTRLRRLRGVPVHQQRLLLSGAELPDAESLQSCGVTHGCRLRLVLALRSGPMGTAAATAAAAAAATAAVGIRQQEQQQQQQLIMQQQLREQRERIAVALELRQRRRNAATATASTNTTTSASTNTTASASTTAAAAATNSSSSSSSSSGGGGGGGATTSSSTSDSGIGGSCSSDSVSVRRRYLRSSSQSSRHVALLVFRDAVGRLGLQRVLLHGNGTWSQLSSQPDGERRRHRWLSHHTNHHHHHHSSSSHHRQQQQQQQAGSEDSVPVRGSGSSARRRAVVAELRRRWRSLGALATDTAPAAAGGGGGGASTAVTAAAAGGDGAAAVSAGKRRRKRSGVPDDRRPLDVEMELASDAEMHAPVLEASVASAAVAAAAAGSGGGGQCTVGIISDSAAAGGGGSAINVVDECGPVTDQSHCCSLVNCGATESGSGGTVDQHWSLASLPVVDMSSDVTDGPAGGGGGAAVACDSLAGCAPAAVTQFPSLLAPPAAALPPLAPSSSSSSSSVIVNSLHCSLPALIRPVAATASMAAVTPAVSGGLGVGGGRRRLPRCAVCRRQLTLAQVYHCQCTSGGGGSDGGDVTVFCGQHRYPETHACRRDLKAEGRALLLAANPLVVADKLPKI